MHDDNLYRSTGVSKRISECTSAELKNIRLKNGEPVPFLKPVLEEFLHQIEFNVEIKGASTKLAARVAEIIDSFGRDGQFVISCFRPEPLIYFKEHRPNIRRACLIGEQARWPNLSEQNPLLFMQAVGAISSILGHHLLMLILWIRPKRAAGWFTHIVLLLVKKTSTAKVCGRTCKLLVSMVYVLTIRVN